MCIRDSLYSVLSVEHIIYPITSTYFYRVYLIKVKISNALEITIDELLYGNLLYNPTEYQTDIDLLMADCTSTEKRYIFEVLSAIKNILRINDWHLSSKHNYDADNPNDY